MGSPTDRDKIYAHKWLWCVELGLSEDDADYIAACDIDMHEFERLLDLGCPPTLAFDICR